MDQFERTLNLIGDDALKRLKNSYVAIFGIGGVGGFVCEALARSGVKKFLLVDNDVVSITNLNRQIIALNSTIGKKKVDVMKERILDINPLAEVETRCCFFLEENSCDFNFSEYDYIVDAVDTVAAKIQIIIQAKNAGVPVISCMGAGNKLDPLKFTVADISKTSVCPLARVIRRELKKRGISNVKTIFSTEEPIKSSNEKTPSSIAFVPSVAGLLIASEVVKDLISHN